MTTTASDALAITRESWHRVAEHVLAAGQLALEVDQLVVIDGTAMRSRPLTTLGDAAAFARVELGLRDSYPPAADGFWNAVFGAALAASRAISTDDAVAFFSEGRARVLTNRSAT